MNRKLVRKLGLLFLILGVLISPISFKQPETKTIITAQGIIDNKRSISYECGTSKSRSTCTDYMLSINGNEHNVSANTFNNYTLGNEIALTTKQYVEGWKLHQILLIVWSGLGCIILGVVVLVETFFFLWWCFISDTKWSYKRWKEY